MWVTICLIFVVIFEILTDVAVDDRVSVGKQDISLEKIYHFIWCTNYDFLILFFKDLWNAFNLLAIFSFITEVKLRFKSLLLQVL